jgi:hypothetical protein
MVVLATMATIIASQAVITGAYSLTRQAIQLKLLPRMRVLHTSHAQAGQIYMPLVNALLALGVVALVLAFGSSSSLASAYGIAVTGTMVFTTMLAATVAVRGWGWGLWRAALLFVPLLAVETVFMGANLVKILEGGYATLLVAALVLATMRVWVKGTQLLAQKDRDACAAPACPNTGNGRVPDGASRHGARRAHAQSQAFQGAACAQRGLDRGHGRRAARTRFRSRQARAARRQFHRRHADVRLHGRAQCAARPCIVRTFGLGF